MAALRCRQNRPRNQFRRQEPRLVIRHTMTQKLGVSPLPCLCVFAWLLHKPSYGTKYRDVHPSNGAILKNPAPFFLPAAGLGPNTAHSVTFAEIAAT